MSRIRKSNRLYGLKARFAATLVLAALISGIVFCLLFFAKEHLIYSFILNEDMQKRVMENGVRDLQSFISRNDLSTNQLSSLKKWEDGQPPILLELYNGDEIVYSSYYYIDNANSDILNDSVGLLSLDDAYEVKFSDRSLSAVMYIDYSYKFYILGNVIAFVAAVVVFILIFLSSNRWLTNYIIRLREDVQILEGGDLDYEVRVEGNDELTDLAKSMNRMRESFRGQLITEQELRQTGSKLISEMSHDLRTPLTGLMLYTEILKSGRYKDKAELDDYLDRIDAKACQIKQLSDNIFEYAIDGRSDNSSENADFEQVLSEIISSIRGEIETAGFAAEADLQWKQTQIQIRRDLTERISDNLVSNILKYADRNAPVFISTIYDNGYCGISIINTVAKGSEYHDSHGIGLGSVKSMMKLMGGTCIAEQTEDSFEVLLLFRRNSAQIR